MLFALALAATPPALADSAGDQLLSTVYAKGGSTLYCKTPFTPGDRLKIDMIYSEKQLLRHFGCITSRQCANKSGYSQVADDMHNMYPVVRSTDLDRRGTLFGDLPDDVETRECGYQLSFQTFDPPDHAKGNVARAMIYMHMQHKLPLIGPLDLYQRWNQADPPDTEEKRRNDAIAKLQGSRNPYIDKPELIDRMTGF
ncbi:MAG: endonuclease [Alcanivoracaceae bacterium]|jgi:deoxyribonuclease-1|nr:endonuclease [Alcanivoracaceae bacterium]